MLFYINFQTFPKLNVIRTTASEGMTFYILKRFYFQDRSALNNLKIPVGNLSVKILKYISTLK